MAKDQKRSLKDLEVQSFITTTKGAMLQGGGNHHETNWRGCVSGADVCSRELACN